MAHEPRLNTLQMLVPSTDAERAADDLRIPAFGVTHPSSWQHRAALVREAIAAFRAGAWYRALLCIDPCCRNPIPMPEDLLLRSEILERLGETQLAAEDVDQAFAINPTLPEIQLRILNRMWRADEDASKLTHFATRLLRSDTSPTILRLVLDHVLDRGNWPAVALPSSNRDRLGVLVLSRRTENITINASFGAKELRASTVTDPAHPKAEILGFAATVDLAWPDGTQVATLSADGAKMLWARETEVRPRFHSRGGREGMPPKLPRTEPGDDTLSVIVPVYRGLKALRRCIDSLFADDATTTRHRLVFVDDRGPDPRIAAALDAAVRRGRDENRDVFLLRNSANVGFISSVNNALATFPSGPVVLLNSDTVVPPGWLDRLADAARGPDVGTVTPLSNNGELTSVPRMFEASELPSDETVRAFDAVAQRVNRGLTVDMPNGIGFCMLVTPAARRVCGYLNDADYREGYLEEVDFCLRAAESGLRNVCACDVFVGHEGGQSFEDRKRELVVRNLGELERRFPSIRRDTHLFRQTDPLSEARRRLELGILTEPGYSGGPIRVHAGSTGRPWLKTRPRGDRHRSDPPVLELRSRIADTGRISVSLSAERLPAIASLDLEFRAIDEVAPAIADLLRPFEVLSVTFVDLLDDTAALFGLPRLLSSPFDLRLTHDDFGEGPVRAGMIASARSVATVSPVLLRGARRLGRDDAELDRRLQMDRRNDAPADPRQASSSSSSSVAVLYEAGNRRIDAFLLDLARILLIKDIPLTLAIFGDRPSGALMKTGRALYAGRPEAAEALAWMRLHGCCFTLCAVDSDSYEHPIQTLLKAAPRPILTFSATLIEPLETHSRRSIHLTPATRASVVADVIAQVPSLLISNPLLTDGVA